MNRYRNGREAKVGDVVIGEWGGRPALGEIVEIAPGGESANVRPLDLKTVALNESLHTEDVFARLAPGPSVRAKFRVESKMPSTGPEGGGTVKLWPVCGGSPENEKFFRLTPGGEIILSTINESAFGAFETGKSYYVDFTPCNPAPQAPPVDNAHVAEGCEKFAAPGASPTTKA